MLFKQTTAPPTREAHSAKNTQRPATQHNTEPKHQHGSRDLRGPDPPLPEHGGALRFA